LLATINSHKSITTFPIQHTITISYKIVLRFMLLFATTAIAGKDKSPAFDCHECLYKLKTGIQVQMTPYN
jgi:hypothetical protein